MTVTMTTIIGEETVTYTVRDGERETWRAVITIGKTKRTRAGGPAFAAAAREQERQAQLAVDAEQKRRQPVEGGAQ